MSKSTKSSEAHSAIRHILQLQNTLCREHLEGVLESNSNKSSKYHYANHPTLHAQVRSVYDRIWRDSCTSISTRNSKAFLPSGTLHAQITEVYVIASGTIPCRSSSKEQQGQLCDSALLHALDPAA